MLYRISNIFLPLCGIFIFVEFTFQTSADNQLRSPHLQETKFSFNEYSEYPDADDKGPQAPVWSEYRNRDSPSIRLDSQSTPEPTLSVSEGTESNIVWDSQWPKDGNFGQISAVSIDPDGNVGVFHRGSRIWDTGSFPSQNIFDQSLGAISEKTIALLDKEGRKVVDWGENMFFMPHGLTIDHAGNYWITDVGLHQVFKFDSKDVPKNFDELHVKRIRSRTQLENDNYMRPSLTLGEAFQPGNDNKRFCKPTGVAVQHNGDFFVSDGYCNSRIIKFNARGERILTWGRQWAEIEENWRLVPPPNAFLVPHALALAEEFNYIFVADRENGRVVCFHSTNGTFHKEYRNAVIGARIFSVAYADKKIYLVNGPEFYRRVARVRGYVLDMNNGDIVSQFSPGKDLENPHDLAVTQDGRSIYVVELSPYKIFKFTQGVNSTISDHKTVESPGNGPASSMPVVEETEPSSNANIIAATTRNGVTATTIILSLVTAAVVLIVFCVAVAAIVARCRKRGCLLTVRRSMRWDSERRENFKLSNFLEGRRNKTGKFFGKRPNTRDFSKLNTEPETSDEETGDNNLTKII